MYLAGDVGGTKTHLAIFDERAIIEDRIYTSHEYDGLEPIILDFLKFIKKVPIEASTIGIAGPIVDGICKTPNLPWVIQRKKIIEKTKLKNLSLINDLEANAYGVQVLKGKDLCFLSANTAVRKGNAGVIAAGTGLGEAGMYWDGKRHHPFATEAGHADFSPKDAEQIEFLQFVLKEFDHVSYDRILSGSGLVRMFRFYVEKQKTTIPEEMQEQMEKTDPAKVITEDGLKKNNPLCMKALELFAKIYGAEAGNMALRFMTKAGVYLGGGIAPKILPILKKPFFMKTFIEKGRMTNLLKQMSVAVILNDQTALLGSFVHAKQNK